MNTKRRLMMKRVAAGLGLWLQPGAAAYFGALRGKARATETKEAPGQPVTFVVPRGFKSNFERVWNELLKKRQVLR